MQSKAQVRDYPSRSLRGLPIEPYGDQCSVKMDIMGLGFTGHVGMIVSDKLAGAGIMPRPSATQGKQMLQGPSRAQAQRTLRAVLALITPANMVAV